MKTTFLKVRNHLIDMGISLLFFDGFCVFVYFAFLRQVEGIFPIFPLTILAIHLLVSFPYLLAKKYFFSKIEISLNGIRWFIGKKTFAIIPWKDIQKISVGYRLQEKCFLLSLFRPLPGERRNEFYFTVSRNSLESLSHFCQNVNLVPQLKTLISNREYRPYRIRKKNID
jgi:hypothetical protein